MPAQCGTTLQGPASAKSTASVGICVAEAIYKRGTQRALELFNQFHSKGPKAVASILNGYSKKSGAAYNQNVSSLLLRTPLAASFMTKKKERRR